MQQEARHANDLDRYIGRMVRVRRRGQALTIQQLAGQVGISWQQLSKYETGINRISAGRLYRVAGALSVPVTDFFPRNGAPS